MIYARKLYRSPDREGGAGELSKYDPAQSESLAQTRQQKQPVTSSPGEEPYTGSHADNYDPDQTSAQKAADGDGPSGENTKTGTEQGGGLYTSGGQVTTGTPYHDED